MRIVIVGYYGMGNIGDDLMLRSLLMHLCSNDSIKTVTVFCNNNYFQPHPKTRFIASSLTGKCKKFIALYQADLVCWGGGTCIFEHADNYGLYRLRRFQKLSARLNTPFAFLGIGIGTITSHEIKNVAREILTSARFVSFRDDDSLFVARNVLGYSKAGMECGDLASLGWRKTAEQRREGGRQGEISFSGVFGQTAEVAEHWGKQLAHLVTELGVQVNFLPAHTRETDDNQFHQQVAAYLKSGTFTIHTHATPFEFIQLLGQMDFHIGMRLHSVIIADILGVPNIAVEYSPKVVFYLRKSEAYLVERLVQPLENIDADRVERVFTTYKQPAEFLDAEEKSAVASLEALLAEFR